MAIHGEDQRKLPANISLCRFLANFPAAQELQSTRTHHLQPQMSPPSSSRVPAAERRLSVLLSHLHPSASPLAGDPGANAERHQQGGINSWLCYADERQRQQEPCQVISSCRFLANSPAAQELQSTRTHHQQPKMSPMSGSRVPAAERRLSVLLSHLHPSASPLAGDPGANVERHQLLAVAAAEAACLSASPCAGGGEGVSSGSGYCIFCEIVKGTKPAYKLYEDDMCLCIRNVKPPSPGHSLVSPKGHFPSLQETSPSELSSSTTELPQAQYIDFVGRIILEVVNWINFFLKWLLPLPTSYTWQSSTLEPLEQNAPSSCTIVACTVCINAHHKLNFERFFGQGTFRRRVGCPKMLRRFCGRTEKEEEEEEEEEEEKEVSDAAKKRKEARKRFEDKKKKKIRRKWKETKPKSEQDKGRKSNKDKKKKMNRRKRTVTNPKSEEEEKEEEEEKKLEEAKAKKEAKKSKCKERNKKRTRKVTKQMKKNNMIWNSKKGSTFHHVLSLILTLDGIPTASEPRVPMLPLLSYREHMLYNFDIDRWLITPQKAARLIYLHGPCLLSMFVTTEFFLHFTVGEHDNDACVYPGGPRNLKERKECKKKDPNAGNHAVVAYAYRFVEKKLQILILDNQNQSGPKRWVAFEGCDNIVTISVAAVDPHQIYTWQ